MTADDLREARKALGLSADALARLLNAESGRTVRRWEAGESNVPGPVDALLTACMESAAVREHFGLTLAPAHSDTIGS